MAKTKRMGVFARIEGYIYGTEAELKKFIGGDNGADVTLSPLRGGYIPQDAIDDCNEEFGTDLDASDDVDFELEPQRPESRTGTLRRRIKDLHKEITGTIKDFMEEAGVNELHATAPDPPAVHTAPLHDEKVHTLDGIKLTGGRLAVLSSNADGQTENDPDQLEHGVLLDILDYLLDHKEEILENQ